jgi:hypothetical protein
VRRRRWRAGADVEASKVGVRGSCKRGDPKRPSHLALSSLASFLASAGENGVLTTAGTTSAGTAAAAATTAAGAGAAALVGFFGGIVVSLCV